MFFVLCIFSVVVFESSAAETVPLPPFTICKRNSVNYSDCLKTAMQEAWPHFVKGLPEFDFPPLEPLLYEFGHAVFDRGDVHGSVNVSNMFLTGIAKIRFLSGKSHFADNIFRLEIDARIPKLEGSGECDAVGTLGAFKMGGKGVFNLTMEVIEASWILAGPVANDTWTVKSFHTTPSVKKLKLQLDNLFSKELNDIIMIFVNEYWPVLYRVMLPTVSEAWDPWLCDKVNNFFSKVSFKQLFP